MNGIRSWNIREIYWDFYDRLVCTNQNHNNIKTKQKKSEKFVWLATSTLVWLPINACVYLNHLKFVALIGDWQIDEVAANRSCLSRDFIYHCWRLCKFFHFCTKATYWICIYHFQSKCFDANLTASQRHIFQWQNIIRRKKFKYIKFNEWSPSKNT